MQNPRTRYEAKSGSSPSYRLPASHSNRQLKQQSDFDDEIDYESLVTEDDEPVDSLYSERQMRLLTDALYASWDYNKPFLACANVGIFEKRPKKTIPIVPDMFLSLNVKPAKDFWKKKNRCYMISIFGKPPELVVEIVSNKVGKERGSKFRQYESMGIKYYVIFDPEKHLFKTNLHAYELINGRYVAFPWKEINTNGVWFPDLKLGLRLESFLYQAMKTEWLSWFNDQGTLYPGEVQARRIVKNAEMEKKKEEMEKKKVEMEKKRANAAEKLLEAAQKELALLKKKLHQNS